MSFSEAKKNMADPSTLGYKRRLRSINLLDGQCCISRTPRSTRSTVTAKIKNATNRTSVSCNHPSTFALKSSPQLVRIKINVAKECRGADPFQSTP